jgi:ABC-type polysaccharide/polyol phosphate export permease
VISSIEADVQRRPGRRIAVEPGLTDSRNLNLLRELTLSQFKLKDQSTFFGLLWSFLNPLVMVVILFTFFGKRFGQSIENYGLFLLIGMVQYTHFANATSNSMRALLTMRQLTKETAFPKELIVLSSILSNTIDFLIAMVMCVAVAYAAGVNPGWHLLALPVVVAVQFLLVVWVSFILSCVFPLARDLEHIYQAGLRALLFVTPIFYAKTIVGDGVPQYLMILNPLAQLIDASRSILIHAQAPRPLMMLAVTTVNVALVWATWRLFKALETRLAEYV